MYHKIIAVPLVLFIAGIANAQAPSADSLSRVAYVKKQTSKADSLTRIALASAKPGAGNSQLNQALTQFDTALHIYSKYRQLDGVRQSFDNMAFVYRLQKKHSQEKWYILQSNTLSRNQLDTPNIINSLIRLAAVKKDIKDYELAEQDLTEAAYLAQKTANNTLRISILQSLAKVYAKSNNLKAEANVLNNIDHLNDSISKQAASQTANAAKVQSVVSQNAVKNNVELNAGIHRLIMYILLIISTLIVLILILYLIKKTKKNTPQKPGSDGNSTQ